MGKRREEWGRERDDMMDLLSISCFFFFSFFILFLLSLSLSTSWSWRGTEWGVISRMLFLSLQAIGWDHTLHSPFLSFLYHSHPDRRIDGQWMEEWERKEMIGKEVKRDGILVSNDSRFPIILTLQHHPILTNRWEVMGLGEWDDRMGKRDGMVRT